MPVPMRRQIHPHDLSVARTVRKYLVKHGPFEIVHGHSSKGGALARMAAVGLGAKIVYTPNAFVNMNLTLPRIQRWAYGSIERWLASFTNLLITTSPEEHRFALEMGIPAHKMCLIPNGIASAAMPTRADARGKIGCPPEDVVVGFVGRLNSQKNPELLVEAFARIADDLPRSRVVMVGDGELLPRLVKMIAHRRLEDRVRLLGWQDGRSLMPGFDFLVLPSRYEGFPYVAMEAMHAGLPLVATRSSSTSLLIDHGLTGYSVEADPQFLAEAMASLIADAELRAEFSRRAVQKVEEFSLEKMVESTLGVYHQLTERRLVPKASHRDSVSTPR